MRELELAQVLEESKVSAAESVMVHLREELEEKVRVAQESETQAKVEEAFLTNKVAQLNTDLEKMRGRAETAEAKEAVAEAKVVASEKEMEGVAVEAIYLAWSHNRSMDLSFLGDPSVLARFETKLAAEAPARLAVSEGRVPEADPVVVIESEVPPVASKTPQA